MGRARYNTGLFPLPDNVLPVQLFGGTSPHQTAAKTPHPQPPLLTVTHLNLPSGEGQGVCDVRSQPPKPKAVTQNLTDNTSPKQQQKHFTPTPAPHRHTPLNPLSRGESTLYNCLITKKETASQLSPLERGRGCVTSAHSLLNPKAVTQNLTDNTSPKQQQKHFSPSRASHHHTPL